MSKSLLDLAYDFISTQKDPVPFATICDYIAKESGLSKEELAQKLSRFYTNLVLDGRFVTLGENTWDLRSRHTFDKVHIDMKDVYSDVEAPDDDEEEEIEEKEYNEIFEEKQTEDDAPVDSDEEVDTL
ncbi:MAG: DNA-directed RNA polymerase subunit delta [Erysipelotrichaceae bacterium]|nr:DNA-directed RNA polymerase subunit delta [Bacilli bacterium]NLV28778.1 DNA-directed RNA polymerase subunit delta [Erysipelotrichaceae bacterium]